MGILAGIVGALPFLTSVITAIEDLHGKGNGAQKKKDVLTIATAGLSSVAAARGQTLNTTQLQQEISVATDIAVAILNQIGVFQHATPAPAAK